MSDAPPDKAQVLAVLATGLERDIAARDNLVVGLYAEALVAPALGRELAEHRWESWDVVAADRGRIQVKTSTALGIRKLPTDEPSRPSWRGFKAGQRWLVETNDFEPEAQWHADVWILARVEDEDPFNHDNWSFFVLSRDAVQALGTQSTSDATLVARGHEAVKLTEPRSDYERVRSS